MKEWYELVTECQWEWSSVNGKNGFHVTGPSGNTIFIPVAGRLYHDGGSNANGYENISGFYWTSTLAEDDGLPLSLNKGVPLLLSSSQGAAAAYRNIAKRLEGQRVSLLRIR